LTFFAAPSIGVRPSMFRFSAYHAGMSALIEDLALLIDRGGYVMIPLLALSVISLALIVERSVYWVLLHRPRKLRELDDLNDALRRGDRKRLNRLTRRSNSPYAQVAEHMAEQGATDAVAMEVVQRHRPSFDRFMVSLSTIITAAPLLGILGTVIGIIQSFKLLGDLEVLHEPRGVAAGIAEALLTTALGLIVALMTLFPYMIFRGQVDRALGRLEALIASAQQGLVSAASAAAHGLSAAKPEGAGTSPDGDRASAESAPGKNLPVSS
jgi:biopolymer transport protein ExbB